MIECYEVRGKKDGKQNGFHISHDVTQVQIASPDSKFHI